MTTSLFRFLSLLLAANSLSTAAELHVSPNGAAANSGTREKPFTTIQQGVDATKPGDTLIIHAGTYRESVCLTRSGSAPKPITITAAANPLPPDP